MYFSVAPGGMRTLYRFGTGSTLLNGKHRSNHYASVPNTPQAPRGPNGKDAPDAMDEERHRPETFDKKHRIHFHRSYRKLEKRSFRQIAIAIFVLVILVDWLILNIFNHISRILSRIAADALTTCVPAELVQIVQKPFIHDYVYIATVPGRYPSIALSVTVAIISLVVMFMAYTRKKAIEPKMVWLVFIFFITLMSALFFIFFQGYFPYDVEFFSEMYMKTEVGIWLTIPLILTIALLPFPLKWYKKLTIILMTLSYSLVFALVRYIVFLYLLRTTTYLFMALMFFMLGPFLDFIYIVGAYSLTISKVAVKTREDQKLWNWLY